MRRVSARDVEGFGRVLEVLGQFLQKNPQALMKILLEDGQDSTVPNREPPSIDLAKMDAFPLFDFSKTNDRTTTVQHLTQFSTEELRYLLRKYHLGGSKLRSKDQILEHIVEQVSKRTLDVFRDHSPASEASKQ